MRGTGEKSKALLRGTDERARDLAKILMEHGTEVVDFCANNGRGITLEEGLKKYRNKEIDVFYVPGNYKNFTIRDIVTFIRRRHLKK